MATARVPLVRPVAWVALIPQLLVLAALIGLVSAAAGLDAWEAAPIGAGIYLVYSFGSRWLVARHHRRGMALTKRGDFEESIPHFERSFDFFSDHQWIDRWRPLVLLSSAALSYREMALVNIGFCHAQAGHADAAVRAYRRALDEFPDSVIARSALRMADTFGADDGGPDSSMPTPTHR